MGLRQLVGHGRQQIQGCPLFRSRLLYRKPLTKLQALQIGVRVQLLEREGLLISISGLNSILQRPLLGRLEANLQFLITLLIWPLMRTPLQTTNPCLMALELSLNKSSVKIRESMRLWRMNFFKNMAAKALELLWWTFTYRVSPKTPMLLRGSKSLRAT